MSSVFAHASALDPLRVLARVRQGFCDCLCAREDALFELADALLCSAWPVKTLVELCLAAEHRRGHGGMYAALNEGDIEPERVRWAVAAMPVPQARGGRIVLASATANREKSAAACRCQRVLVRLCRLRSRGRTRRR